MERVNRKDIILKGDMYKAIFYISVPLMINNLIHTLYNLADAMWVIRLGTVEFAATSFVGPVIMFFNALGMGISVAGTSILSQLIGSSKDDEANKYASQLIVISLLFSIFITLLGYWLSPYIVSWMGGSGELAVHSNTYLRICLLGFPFIFLFFMLNSILTAQGNTVITTILSAVSAIANVFLNPIFIFEEVPLINMPGLGLGIAGAAIATVLSQSILLIGGVFLVKKYSTNIRPSFKGFAFSKSKIKEIARVSIPASVGQTGASLGFMVLNSFIAGYGTVTLAAFGMGNRITNIIMQPPMGIGMGLTTIVGQNMGAKNMDRVYEAFKKALMITIIIGLIGTFILYFFNMTLVTIFSGSEDNVDVLREGAGYLKYIAISMPFMGMYSIFTGLFQGSGHTKYSMVMGIGRLWFVRLPLIIIFSKFTNLGSTGIWISMSISNFIICVYGYIVYKSAKWEERIITDNKLKEENV